MIQDKGSTKKMWKELSKRKSLILNLDNRVIEVEHNTEKIILIVTEYCKNQYKDNNLEKTSREIQ